MLRLNENRREDGSFKVITLCGSTKFKDKFLEVQKKLTLSGYIVIAPGEYSKADGEELPNETVGMLTELHKQKIDMADGIFVVNCDGYIGESTKAEIEYAVSIQKPINFLENDEEEQILYKFGSLLNILPEYYKDAVEKAMLHIVRNNQQS